MVGNYYTVFVFGRIIILSVETLDFTGVLRLVENFYKEFLDFFIYLCENKLAQSKTPRGFIIVIVKGVLIWIKNQWELFLRI